MKHIKNIATAAACSALVAFVVFCAFPKQVIIQAPAPQLNAGAVGEQSFSGASSQGEVSVATSDTNIVERNGGRIYLQVCKTSLQHSGQVTFAINASASDGRGIVLNNNRPCWESTDASLVSGLLEGVASPSAASVSYTQW